MGAALSPSSGVDVVAKDVLCGTVVMVDGRRIKISKRIGGGGFGSVYEVDFVDDERNESSHKLVAKVVERDINAKVFGIESEIEALTRCRNLSGVVQMAFHGSDETRAYIVLEHCVGGDLLTDLRYNRTYSEASATKVLAQLAKGLIAVHGTGYLHLDVKPDNILLTDMDRTSPVVKLTDFNCSREFKTVDDRGNIELLDVRSSGGTPNYQSPEVIENLPLGPWTDVFSLGVTLYMMLTLRPPFYNAFMSGKDDADCLASLRAAVLIGKFDEPPGFQALSQPAQQLLRAMLHPVAEQRITLQDILKHEFVTGEPSGQDSGTNLERGVALTPRRPRSSSCGGAALPCRRSLRSRVITRSRELSATLSSDSDSKPVKSCRSPWVSSFSEDLEGDERGSSVAAAPVGAVGAQVPSSEAWWSYWIGGKSIAEHAEKWFGEGSTAETSPTDDTASSSIATMSVDDGSYRTPESASTCLSTPVAAKLSIISASLGVALPSLPVFSDTVVIASARGVCMTNDNAPSSTQHVERLVGAPQLALATEFGEDLVPSRCGGGEGVRVRQPMKRRRRRRRMMSRWKR